MANHWSAAKGKQALNQASQHSWHEPPPADSNVYHPSTRKLDAVLSPMASTGALPTPTVRAGGVGTLPAAGVRTACSTPIDDASWKIATGKPPGGVGW